MDKIAFGIVPLVDSDTKNYELAYLLSPAVSEEDVLGYASKLTGVIKDEKGTIRHIETPKKRRLEYPIKKEGAAYFGWTTFAIAPAAIGQIEKKVKETPHLLRHLIVEEEIETRRPFLRPITPRPAGGMDATPRAIPREEEKPEEKLDLEALDKRLEEILGK